MFYFYVNYFSEDLPRQTERWQFEFWYSICIIRLIGTDRLFSCTVQKDMDNMPHSVQHPPRVRHIVECPRPGNTNDFRMVPDASSLGVQYY